ncbi:MAG: hypothetical protein V9F01_16895 [Chitinophagaceae bacterium]
MIKVKGKNPLPVVTTDVNSKVITAKRHLYLPRGKIYFYGKADAVEISLFFQEQRVHDQFHL